MCRSTTTDSAVIQNASKSTVSKHGSRGISEQSQHIPVNTTDDKQSTQNLAVTKHGSQGSSTQHQPNEDIDTAVRTEETKQRTTQKLTTIPEHPEITREDIMEESTEKRPKLYIGNISTDTTAEDLLQLLQLNTTAFLR